MSAVLDFVKFVNDLGVIFDKDLSFREHIDNMTVQAYRMLGFFLKETVVTSMVLKLLSLSSFSILNIIVLLDCQRINVIRSA